MPEGIVLGKRPPERHYALFTFAELAGDPPKEMPPWLPSPEELEGISEGNVLDTYASVEGYDDLPTHP